jgi:hypothetical protein
MDWAFCLASSARVRSALTSGRPLGSSTEAGGADEQEIPETARVALARLREALENEEEIRPIDRLLKELKRMVLPLPLQRAVTAISDSVMLSEFSRAKDIIDDLLARAVLR